MARISFLHGFFCEKYKSMTSTHIIDDYIFCATVWLPPAVNHPRQPLDNSCLRSVLYIYFKGEPSTGGKYCFMGNCV